MMTRDAEFWWSTFGVINPKSGVMMRRPQPNKLQRDVFSYYRKCRAQNKPCLFMILKPRQKGASTIAQGLMYYHLRMNGGLKALLMGDIDSTSETVFDLFRTYAQEDLYPWGDGKVIGQNYALEGDQVKEATLTNGSKMKRATAGSKNAGRSNTVQCAHFDEECFYVRTGDRDPMLGALQSFASTQPLALGMRTSTANGPAGAFFDDWRNDRNDWEKIFAAWFEFDDSMIYFSGEDEKRAFAESMDEKEVEEMERFKGQISLEHMNWRRYTIENLCKGDPIRFQQEYPSDDISCFMLSSRPRFALGELAKLKRAAESRLDMEVGTLVTQDGAQRAQWLRDPKAGDIRMFEHVRTGCHYVISVDTCSGEDQQMGGKSADPDKHDVQVWRRGYLDVNEQCWVFPRMVARHSSRVDSDMLVEVIVAMSLYYGKCPVVPEVNGEAGLHVIKLLLEKTIPVFKRKADVNIMKKTAEERVEAYGWRTTVTTRKWIIDNLVKPIREGEIELSDPDVYHQFERFMVNDKGKAEAMQGEKDDAVISAAIGFYNLGLAKEYSQLKRVRARGNQNRLPDGFTIVNT